MATARQILANQHNAQKSTGPVTEAGKAHSRANALKHGLTGGGTVLTPAQEAAVQQRLESWRSSFRIAGERDAWTYRQMIVSTVQIDHCQAEAAKARTELATRARDCWDDDRRREAAALGKRLAADPAVTVGTLLRTVQGCHWLLDRWEALGVALQTTGTWTEEQQSLALDLLGKAPELRIPGMLPWEQSAGGTRAKLVEAQISQLLGRVVRALQPLDDLERESAVQGQVVGAASSLETAKAIERLRRQEQACWRRMRAAESRLEEVQPTSQPAAAEPAPEPVPAPAPAPAPAKAPAPATGTPKRTQCDTGQAASTVPSARAFTEVPLWITRPSGSQNAQVMAAGGRS